MSMSAFAYAIRDGCFRRILIQGIRQHEGIQSLFQRCVKITNARQQSLVDENGSHGFFVHVGQKRGHQFRRRVTMNRVHVDGDPGGARVVARVHQAARHFRQALLSCANYTVVTAQNLVLLGLSPDNNRRKKAVSGNALSQCGRLFFGEILRVPAQRHQIRQRDCDVRDFRRRAQSAIVQHPAASRHSTR